MDVPHSDERTTTAASPASVTAPADWLRALIVAYSFPPVGGAGVQRMLKLAKYLPEHHVVPTVLTVANPSVPLTDASLLHDLPPGIQVLRARTLEPGYALKRAAWNETAHHRKIRLGALAKELLVPDAQILWQPGAQAAMLKKLYFSGPPPQVVLISAPPFSQFLLAPIVRLLRRKVAVILDYRDEWSTYRTAYEMMGGRIGSKIGDPLESALLRTAHAVITATEEFRDNLLSHFRFLDPARVHAIPNGYDADDFPTDLPSPPRDRFVIGYAGTVFKLTSVRGFLGAVRLLHERAPELARHLHVRFIGRIVDTELDAFEGMEALGVERVGYLEHAQSLIELSRSHLVLCTLDEVPGVERIYPAKIFELMYLGRPCLTLSPPGALTRLVSRHRLGDVLPPRDEARIAAYLEARLRAFREGNGHARAAEASFAPRGIERYARRALAGEFAAVMREASRLAD
ncbi:glycosyltransferase [Pendulispora brunnea]|uniref:Glycosyltransferase n=1 Tax=Pendulispora brunnea TaxID=2905690 RepID=A0ABZ2K0N8_9BACT